MSYTIALAGNPNCGKTSLFNELTGSKQHVGRTHTMRTPLGLIPEGNDIYTIVYAAINNDMRFHPMGMVQVKLNREVLEEITKNM